MTIEFTITGLGLLWTVVCILIGTIIGWYSCKDHTRVEVHREAVIAKAKAEGRQISPWSGLPYPPTPPYPYRSKHESN